MAREARIILPGSYYHIISRSINEVEIFRDEEDFLYFKKLMLLAKRKFPIKIFHYVLMNTHFHILIQASDHKSLSQNISLIKWKYTFWMNKKYSWQGPIWRERYRSYEVNNEKYLKTCGEYIENNPVRAGIIEQPQNYLFSSYRKYHLGVADSLVDDYTW